jgi:hypothetical protein
MSRMIAKGCQWLETMRRRHTAGDVAYSRGSQSATIPATRSSSTFDVTDEQGVLVRVESVDFLVEFDDMQLDDVPTEPQRGDRITDQGVVFEALPPAPNMPVWEWTNPHRTGYRVHTKPVAKAP